MIPERRDASGIRRNTRSHRMSSSLNSSQLLAMSPSPAMDRRNRILIADDYSVVRERVRSTLERHSRFEVCGKAEDGYEAIREAHRLKPDVVDSNVSVPVLKRVARSKRVCPTERPSYYLRAWVSVSWRKPKGLALGHRRAQKDKLRPSLHAPPGSVIASRQTCRRSTE
jgi:hypothetical protein